MADLQDLRDRMSLAEQRLLGMAEQERILALGHTGKRHDHLTSKAEGVRLAMSYLDEIIRGESA